MMPADHRARGRIGQVSGTVRFRVTALAVVAVAGVLLATGMVLVTAQRRLLTDNVEELIRQHADDLATIVTSGQVPAILTHTEGTLEQIVTPDGKVLAASPDLGAAPHSAHRHRQTGPRSCTPSSLCPPNLPSSGS